MNENMPKVTPGEGALGAALAALVAHYLTTGEGEIAVCVVAAALALSHAVIRYARNVYGAPIGDDPFEDDEGDDETLTVPETWDPASDPADAL